MIERTHPLRELLRRELRCQCRERRRSTATVLQERWYRQPWQKIHSLADIINQKWLYGVEDKAWLASVTAQMWLKRADLWGGLLLLFWGEFRHTWILRNMVGYWNDTESRQRNTDRRLRNTDTMPRHTEEYGQKAGRVRHNFEELWAILEKYWKNVYTVLFKVNTPPLWNFFSLIKGGGVFTMPLV